MGREVGDGRDANRSVVMGGEEGGGGGGGGGYTGEGGVWWRGVVCSASSPRDDPGSSPRDGRAGYEFYFCLRSVRFIITDTGATTHAQILSAYSPTWDLPGSK